MSSTRYARDDRLHPDRFASSPEYARGGVPANLVTKRCDLLPEAPDREFCRAVNYFLHQPGGAAQFCTGFLRNAGGQLGTPLMRKLGIRPGTIYSSEQAQAIRREIERSGGTPPTDEGMRRDRLSMQAAIANSLRARLEGRIELDRSAAAVEITERTFKAESFLNLNALAQDILPELLREICTNPEREIASYRPWWLPNLVTCLREYISLLVEQRAKLIVPTAVTEQVFSALDSLEGSGGLIVMQGPARRVGQSYACRTWCELGPGRRYYVKTPSTNDDKEFQRAIAQKSGSPSGLSYTNQQIRERNEKTLRGTGLTVVFDDAEFLMPQSNRREHLPNRLNWIRTSLVDQGVRVALMCTPQFISEAKAVEKKTGWLSSHFFVQIREFYALPERLTLSELSGIAASFLPGADKDTVEIVAAYAHSSDRFLTGIEAVADRAKFLAKQAGSQVVGSAHARQAVEHYSIPSDQALKRALEADAGSVQSTRRAAAAVRQPDRAIQPAASGEGNPLPAPCRAIRPAGHGTEDERIERVSL
jgi:hypothetical protein